MSVNNELSPFFGSMCGVRQGEIPVLFSMEKFLFDKLNQGMLLDINTNEFVIFKIIVLLYADDTIILADTADALQASLNSFFDYCRLWKLSVNIDKTKIIVFGSRRNQHFNFKLGSNYIEIVDSYKYLGVFFLKARKHVVEQARKALYYLYTRICQLIYNLSCLIKQLYQS